MATLVPVNSWTETKGKVSEAEERAERKSQWKWTLLLCSIVNQHVNGTSQWWTHMTIRALATYNIKVKTGRGAKCQCIFKKY